MQYAGILSVLIYPCYLHAEQQSNFNITPSPIAYSFFEAKRLDGTVDLSFVNISVKKLVLEGAFCDFKGRFPFSDSMAIDGEAGFGGLLGDKPGVMPITPTIIDDGQNYYSYRVDGLSSLSLFLFRSTCNVEYQFSPMRIFSLIVFGGPNIGISNIAVKTPYSLIVPSGYPNVGEAYAGNTDRLSILSLLYGGQCGIHADIPALEELRFSPFFMISIFSGTGSMTDNPANSHSRKYYGNVNVPVTISYALGINITVINLSVGFMLQQIRSQGNDEQNARVMMISVGYRFLSCKK
jgi:hypothetical protein